MEGEYGEKFSLLALRTPYLFFYQIESFLSDETICIIRFSFSTGALIANAKAAIHPIIVQPTSRFIFIIKPTLLLFNPITIIVGKGYKARQHMHKNVIKPCIMHKFYNNDLAFEST
jgi:hypothetical protein